MPRKLQEGSFILAIDFEKGVETPSRIFRAMTDLIEAFSAFDRDLLQSVDSTLRPVMVLEDVETGSIRAIIRTIVEIPDDKDLRDGNVKRILGSYAVKAKEKLLKFTNERNGVSNREELRQLSNMLSQGAEETNYSPMNIYGKMTPLQLAGHVENITEAVRPLSDHDSAVLVVDEGDGLTINRSFHIERAELEQLLTRETIVTPREMYLQVKKPDYLGRSQWEFRHGNNALSARIDDDPWLRRFQKREIDVRPGDALHVKVVQTECYGHDNELIKMSFSIVEVIGVAPGEINAQLRLLD